MNYYNEIKKTVLDAKGNEIIIQENLKEIKEQNLILYLEELFDSFYSIQDKFNKKVLTDTSPSSAVDTVFGLFK